MKYAHFVELRVFAKEGDDIAAITDAMHKLIPLDFNEEKIELKTINAQGFTSMIKILEVFLKRQRHTTVVLERSWLRSRNPRGT